MCIRFKSNTFHLMALFSIPLLFILWSCLFQIGNDLEDSVCYYVWMRKWQSSNKIRSNQQLLSFVFLPFAFPIFFYDVSFSYFITYEKVMSITIKPPSGGEIGTRMTWHRQYAKFEFSHFRWVFQFTCSMKYETNERTCSFIKRNDWLMIK